MKPEKKMPTSPNLKKFLYLLKVLDKPVFKIGVSSENRQRIESINNLITIDFAASFVVLADDDSSILPFERTLLKSYSAYSLTDELLSQVPLIAGASELRHIACFDWVIKDIAEREDFRLVPLKEFELISDKSNRQPISMKKDFHAKAVRAANMDGLTFAAYTRRLIHQDLVKKGIITLEE